ncbi:MAG: C45 family autoproteolytic acyltransferase/hydrolase [Turneriella sp.]|nr:C45 family autoproteolytic acyltransferase/hydrolase [Turneriella sp.]
MPTERTIKQPLLILRLRGSQESMGAQYGEIMAAHGGFHDLVEFYPQMAERLLLSGLPRLWRQGAVRLGVRAAVNWALSRLARQRMPQYLPRTEAAVRAMGSTAVARSLLIMDAFQNYIGQLGKWQLLPGVAPILPQAVGACTSAVVFGSLSADGELMHARNFDFPGVGIWDQAPTLVYCKPEDGIPYGYVGARGADVPGITGFNAEGLSLTFHTRFHREISFSGVGVTDLAHEIIRTARTIDEAIAVCGRFQIASSWGIVVASAKENDAALIETCAQKIRVVRASNDGLACTNHYLHPHMVEGEVATSDAWTSYTVDRLRLVQRFFRDFADKGGATMADMQRLLGADYEVDAPGKSRMLGSLIAHIMSVQSVVFKLRSGVIAVSVGETPTGWGPYIEHKLDWSGGPVTVVEPATEKLFSYECKYAHGQGLEAYRALKQAYLGDLYGENLDLVRSWLKKALSLAPEDSSLHFASGILSLEAGDIKQGFESLLHAATLEESPYRKAQALLWAARAAAALNKKNDASMLRAQIGQLEHHNLAALRRAAAKDSRAWYNPRFRDTTLSFAVLGAFPL